MAWLAGLKIKKNILLEQQPLSQGDDAELAAMRRMVMDDALKRKSMAQRVGILAYVKNRPQVDASVVKNVVSNVSSFNRYRSEKDYEEWVIRERERGARLQAARSERTAQRSDEQSSDSGGDSSRCSQSKRSMDISAPSDEQSALKRQVIERLRHARADDSARAPDVVDCSRPRMQYEREHESRASCDGIPNTNVSEKGGDDMRSGNRHSSSRRGGDEQHSPRERARDGHRDRSRERERDGDRRSRHRDDRDSESQDNSRNGKKKNDRDLHRTHCDHDGERRRHHDGRDKDDKRKESRRHRDEDDAEKHASAHEGRRDMRRERSRDERGDR
jgi:hypothetical protein